MKTHSTHTLQINSRETFDKLSSKTCNVSSVQQCDSEASCPCSNCIFVAENNAGQTNPPLWKTLKTEMLRLIWPEDKFVFCSWCEDPEIDKKLAVTGINAAQTLIRYVWANAGPYVDLFWVCPTLCALCPRGRDRPGRLANWNVLATHWRLGSSFRAISNRRADYWFHITQGKKINSSWESRGLFFRHRH